jgi:hypothetical protein
MPLVISPRLPHPREAESPHTSPRRLRHRLLAHGQAASTLSWEVDLRRLQKGSRRRLAG